LQHLYKAAVDRGLDLSGAVTLGLDPDFVSTIDVTISWINAYHSEGYPGHYALRYDASTRTLPAGNVVFPIIEAILLAVPT
jgi:hypothetical protein